MERSRHHRRVTSLQVAISIPRDSNGHELHNTWLWNDALLLLMRSSVADPTLHPLADLLRRSATTRPFNNHLRLDMEYTIWVRNLQTIKEGACKAGLKEQETDNTKLFFTIIIETNSLNRLFLKVLIIGQACLNISVQTRTP